jgi:hypothetical protein
MKNWLCLALGIILTMNLFIAVSAVEIKLQKTSYYSQETLQAEIYGGFIDGLQTKNIKIYKQGIVHSSPADSNLIKYETKYYFSATLPQEPGEYSLRIENTNHYEGNLQTRATIEKNFTIAGSNSSYLSFSPGYILATRDFQVTVKAYNEEQNIDITFAPTNFEQNISLGYGRSKILYFSIAGLNDVVKDNINIGSYALPVIIISNSSTANTSKQILSDILDIYPRAPDVTITPNKDWPIIIDISSISDETMDLELSTSDKELKVTPTQIDDFENTKKINITINSNRDFKGYIEINSTRGQVIGSVRIPIQVRITNNISSVNFTTIESSKVKTCFQMGGDICNYKNGEECDVIVYDINNNACCTSGCKTKPKSYGWVWGLLLLIVLGVGGWYAYKKYKKSPDSKSDINKRAEDYKKRMNPEKDFEIRGSLTKE